MSGSDRVVICPEELSEVAGLMVRARDEASAASHRMATSAAGVLLCGRDPNFAIGWFHGRRVEVGRRIDVLATGWLDDSGVLRETVEEAVIADGGGGSLALLDRVVEVIEAQPSSVWRGVFHEELLVRRAELLDDVTGGSRSARVVLGGYSASGGSLSDLFESAAADDGETLARTTYEMADEGFVDEARQLDEALAVARVLLSDDSIVPMDGSATGMSGSLVALEQLVEDGVDVAVAANAALVEGMPGDGELTGLVDRVSSVFGPDGGRVGLSEQQWAWLPFSMRMALSDSGWVAPRAAAERGSGRLHSVPVDGRFRTFGDDLEARVDVIAELGRAGVDVPQQGETLAGLLADMVMPSPDGVPTGWAGLASHRLVADVVGDPSTGVDAAFFQLLGVDGAQALADAVWVEAPVAAGHVGVVGTADQVLARYGDGMAAADQRGELGFGAEDLYANDGAAWTAGGYLGASTTFSETFALEAAVTLVAVGRNPASFGLSDPRSMAVDQVARRGGEASAALFDLLGEDFLDDLLWNAEPIESGHDVHPVYRLFAPVLDNPRLRPGLAVEIAGTAGREHADQGPPLHTGDVIQHAFISDKFLLAPEHAYRLGGANSTGYIDHSPSDEDIVNAVEIVHAAGSGDGLNILDQSIIPHIVFEAWNVEGEAGISEDAVAVYSEIFSNLSVGELNADVREAVDADARINRSKYVVSAVATALPGAFPLGAAASVGTGLSVNLAAGPAFDLFEADNFTGVMVDKYFDAATTQDERQRQVVSTLVQLGAVDLQDVDSLDDFFDVAHLEVTSADGTPSGTLGDWIARTLWPTAIAQAEEIDSVDFID